MRLLPRPKYYESFQLPRYIVYFQFYCRSYFYQTVHSHANQKFAGITRHYWIQKSELTSKRAEKVKSSKKQNNISISNSND